MAFRLAHHLLSASIIAVQRLVLNPSCHTLCTQLTYLVPVALFRSIPDASGAYAYAFIGLCHVDVVAPRWLKALVFPSPVSQVLDVFLLLLDAAKVVGRRVTCVSRPLGNTQLVIGIEEGLQRRQGWVVLGIVFGIAEADKGVVAHEVDVDWVGRVEGRGGVGYGSRLVAVVRFFGQANVYGNVGHVVL